MTDDDKIMVIGQMAAHKSIDVQNISVIENSLYHQNSEQVLKMMEITYKFNETTKDMPFTFEENTESLQVAKIKPDGNCLFRTLAHQLFGAKLYTREQ